MEDKYAWMNEVKLATPQTLVVKGHKGRMVEIHPGDIVKTERLSSQRIAYYLIKSITIIDGTELIKARLMTAKMVEAAGRTHKDTYIEPMEIIEVVGHKD